MKTLKRLACVVMVAGLVTFLWAPSGMATLWTQEQSFTDNAATFQYWDNSWGTLNSVTVAFTMSIDTDPFTLTNNNAYSVSGTATYAVTGYMAAPGGFMLTDSGGNLIASGSNPLSDGKGYVYELSPGQTSSALGGDIFTDSTGDAAVFSMGVAQYVGTGTFDFTVADNYSINTSSGGGFTISYEVPDFAGTAKVTYDYTGDGPPGAPVPEPGTMLLLGIGLIGLAGAGRKRMAHK